MTKEEFINELDALINDEINITNIQRDDFDDSCLKMLWNIKAMAVELES